MRRKRFAEVQIIKALQQHESGMKVSYICRELGIVEQTFYRSKFKFVGMDISEAKCLKALEDKNNKSQKDARRTDAGECGHQGCALKVALLTAHPQEAVLQAPTLQDNLELPLLVGGQGHRFFGG